MSTGATTLNTLLSAGKLKFVRLLSSEALLTSYSLEKQAGRRATPWKMLEHPWMVDMKAKRVNMVKYLSFVWGWEDAKATAQ